MAVQSGLRTHQAVEDDLGVQLAEFLATLAVAGYVETTQQEKRRLIVPFIRWAREAGLGSGGLNERSVDVFLSRPSRRRWHGHHGDPERVALYQFLKHLRAGGVSPPPPSSESSSADVLVRRYLDHLRGQCGLCPRSIEIYTPFVRTFVAAQGLPKRLATLDPSANCLTTAAVVRARR